MTAPAPSRLAELRWYDRDSRDTDACYCPDCRCRKSGDASEPNGRDECCELDGRCECHQEEE